MDAGDVGAQEIVRSFRFCFDKRATTGNAGGGIDEIGIAQVDEHRPAALQERNSIACRQRGGGDGAAVERYDHLRPGTELKNRHVIVRIEPDMF